ncbi:MAG: hypothetical protein JSV16_00550 [Candidatus Hydrogenedentota bacterium]|nr:MAG: hypothetical protein JSV16_00550 [Candidatus Hydrogenedentota bacterium]
MCGSNWKDICGCDVEDKELFAAFRQKLRKWKACLSDRDDDNSIFTQLASLFWDHAVFTTFNEARRLSEERKDPSTGLPGTVIDLLDRNFMDSQAVAIRRLSDPGSTDPNREVCSLRSLFTEIAENLHLYTRENYVCYDGLFYDGPQNDDDLEAIHCYRQAKYDLLSGKNKDERRRDDRVSSTLFADMKKEIVNNFAIMDDVRQYVNKWVAHAAPAWQANRAARVLDRVTLKKFDDCYHASIRIGKKVAFLVDEDLVCMVPVPGGFDQFKNWDKPVVVKEAIEALDKYWDDRATEIDDWVREADCGV